MESVHPKFTCPMALRCILAMLYDGHSRELDHRNPELYCVFISRYDLIVINTEM